MESEENQKRRGGARPGAGRKSKAEEQQLSALMLRAFPPTKRVAVIQSMVKEAIAGNVKAATLLLGYAYGRPKEHVEHSGTLHQQITTIEVVRTKGEDDSEPADEVWEPVEI